MKLKLFLTLTCCFGYLTTSFGPAPAAKVCLTMGIWVCRIPDGADPPHAVDISGKPIPASSAIQPDKPIILAKDSVGSFGELARESAFDHVKHSTDVKYGIDGKTVTTCVECHHTSQPSAPKDQEYLKKFDRKEVLTAAQLASSKEPVQSCRSCHFQSTTEPTSEYPPASVTYPKSSGKRPSGQLTNDVGYHINCNTCHRAVVKKDPKRKAPTGCMSCHTSN
ncbi:MAG: cytochrome c3 family protein [Pyrinomonadaceae bacterium]